MQYRMVDGSARGGENFHPAAAELSISAGAEAGSISVPVIDDGLGEPARVFHLKIPDAVTATSGQARADAVFAVNDSMTTPQHTGLRRKSESGVFGIGWRGTQNVSYPVEVNKDLNCWRRLAAEEDGGVAASGGWRWTPNPAARKNRRFYRIRFRH